MSRCGVSGVSCSSRHSSRFRAPIPGGSSFWMIDSTSSRRPVATERLEEVLSIIQKLDPPGIGARNLEECLLLQLTPETPHRDIVRVLILNHLDDIRHN